MKRVIYPVLAFAVILIIGCTVSKKAEVENPYVGAWEYISATYLVHYLNGQKPDTTFVAPAPIPHAVKNLTKKHFAFGRQYDVKTISGGGGEYTYAGDTFTFYPKYQTNSSVFVGKSFVYKSKIEGDLWTIYRDTIFKNDTVQWKAGEHWKRIIE